jgi:RNA polymerase sigma-70 factor (ECF subfamily)
MQRHDDLVRAFEDAYEELLEPIFRYFFFRLNDRDRAKELAQETFMRAWTYAAGGKEIRAFKPFLYTTANNLFKNELRGKRPAVSLDALRDENDFDVPSGEASPEEAAEARLLMDKVEELPEGDREIVLLRYADGLSLREIAQALDKSEGAAGVQLHRALQKLKKLHENA